MPKKRETVEKSAKVGFSEPAVLEIDKVNDLKAHLEDVKSLDGIIGFILRNSKSAIIDLKDPSRLIDYAILSSSAMEAGEEVSEILKLGNFKEIFVEGSMVNLISMSIGENKVSIFLEKHADSEKVIEKLRIFKKEP
jgi:predicted regulator of Ras-like GTPase activity (Roadblock/LC7/MglB family)